MNELERYYVASELDASEFDAEMERFLDLYEAKTGRALELIKPLVERRHQDEL